MIKIKQYIKFILIIIFILIFWYFSLYRKYDNRNVKNVFGLFSLRNNFDSSKDYLNKNGEIKIDEELISITINSKTISKLVIELYNEKDNSLYTLNYDDCILKNGNTCTYLIEEYKVGKIKIDNYTNKLISINNKKNIKQVKDYIINKLIISFLVTFLIIILFRLSNKYSIDEKIKQKFKKITINKSFIIVASIIGIVTSILIPLYQVPDEQTHINMIYDERNIKYEFQNSISSVTGAEGILTNSDKTVNTSKYFNLNNKIKIKKILNIPKISLIRHFPQSIGMVIGELLHLPVFIYITLCELFALAFYIFICNIALKKIPIKKNLMMMIMLLPVAIQQMASFSYDVVLNSFCFLFIAYILELKYNDKYITNKTILKILLILFVIAICKIPYILIGLLIFILPIRKIKLSFFRKEITYEKVKDKVLKHKAISVILILLLIGICFTVLVKVLLKIDIGRVLIASVLNIKDTFTLYKKTLHLHLPYYFDTITGNLGWFDTKFPILFQAYIYISLLIFTFIENKSVERDKQLLKRKDRIVFYLVALLLIYIIILSMFEWTLMCTNIPNYNKLTVGEYANYLRILPYIGGVQGRYFLPVLPIILIPISSKKITKLVSKLSPILYQIIYYFILFIIMLFILLYRYWI